MKPRERRETGAQDMFHLHLDQIINPKHELVTLSKTVSWSFIEEKCGEVYADGPGIPPLPTRLMAGLTILKYTFNLSDEELCDRWVENPYFQYFCGEEFFHHELPFIRSSLTHWRQRMDEDWVAALLQESLSVAIRTGAMAPQITRRVRSQVAPVLTPLSLLLLHIHAQSASAQKLAPFAIVLHHAGPQAARREVAGAKCKVAQY